MNYNGTPIQHQSLQHPWSNRIAACQGAEIMLQHSPDMPEFFSISVHTPEGNYTFGDYPNVEEAVEDAQRLIDSRTAWCPSSATDHWQPSVWRKREGPRGRLEYWRCGPGGCVLATWQPHGTYWRMYRGICPVVRSHSDRGIFTSHWEAMDVLDALAANRMKDALLD